MKIQIEEIFKPCPIKGYEEVYQISNLGTLKRINRWVNDRVMIGSIIRGYHTATLTHKYQNKIAIIHRLVALAFIPNPENKRTVNHKDGNKLNNHVDNLEWATYKENNNHALETGLCKNIVGENSNLAKLSNNDVLEIRYLSPHLKIRDIAPLYGVQWQTVYRIIKGISWKYS